MLCSQAIIAIHNDELKKAENKIKNADRLLIKHKKKINNELIRYMITAEQEFVEASTLLNIVKNKEMRSIKSLNVSNGAYILGLLDCIGELKRHVYDRIRVGKANEAIKIFKIMENLYLNLYPLAVYDRIIKETRRKLDVNRMIIEDTRSAITEEIRRTDLINIIKKLK